VNIISAIKDDRLFRPFLEDRDKGIPLKSWRNWLTCLRVMYGLNVNGSKSELILKCTGRDMNRLPKGGFSESLILTGRRSGKSKIAAVVAGFEAVLSGKEKLLSKGEIGLVPLIAPSKRQAQVERSYIRAIFEADLLQQEIVSETKEGFKLANGVYISVLVGDFRLVRNFTVLACIISEAAFFGLSEESRIKSDTELLRAVRPSLATVNGRLTCISSPYAQKGYCFSAHKKYFGNNSGRILVWNSPSRTMNPTLPQSVVDDAMTEDLQAAKSEYLGEFRQDIVIWLPREVIESAVKKSRKELLPRFGTDYRAFVDVSGGRSDSSAICISHLQDKKVVIDYLHEFKSPHNPHKVIGMMVETLRKYGVRRITGDNYSGEFASSSFKSHGIGYEKSKLNKSALYLELISVICSNAIELLDDETSIRQLTALERRTRSGGKDVVDHPQGGHDDLANVIGGCSFITSKRKKVAGGMFRNMSEEAKEEHQIKRARLALATMAGR